MSFAALKNNEGKTHLVLFYGPACAPCNSLKPKLRRVAAELQLPLVELNAATERDACLELGIRQVPTVVLVIGNNARKILAGDHPEEHLRLQLVATGVPLP